MVIFEIMGVRKADEGEYCCIAKNKLGTDKATFKLLYLQSGNKLAPKFTTQIKVSKLGGRDDNWAILGYHQSEGWNVSSL